MKNSRIEIAAWSALGLAAGLVTGVVDHGARDVQGAVLVLMIANFIITLPGRASPLPTAMLTVAGLYSSQLGHPSTLTPSMLVAVIPATIAAFGGAIAGRLLDTAAGRLGDAEPPARSLNGTTHGPAVSRRSMLALSLSAIAVAGVPLVVAMLHALDHPLALWLAIVWQVMSLLGWITLTPLILGRWQRQGALTVDNAAPFTWADAATHLVAIVLLTALHAALIVAATAALFIPPGPGWLDLARGASFVYLPLDGFVYLSIVTIAFVSDVGRQQRQAAQRESVLRLQALRARLNPHFLFNTLNSVSVLARAGKTDETVRVVEGVADLLRYVLDERRSVVPLEEELRFAREYLDLQRVRFGDRLSFEVNADAATLPLLVPQLVLQPIVENAVEHGVGGSLSGGIVRITASCGTDGLAVTVEDDGTGPIAGDASHGIGLSHTRERLSRLFGDSARLTIEPRAPTGTRVMIQVPFTPE